MVAEVDQKTLVALEAALLNTSGSVPLHNRFRALFTLKALKNDNAVRIISKGTSGYFYAFRHSECSGGRYSSAVQASRMKAPFSSMSLRTALAR